MTAQYLRQSETRFRAIVETAREWIWAIDLTTTFTYSNPAVMQILGYDPGEFMKLGIEQLHPDDKQMILRMMPERIRLNEGWTNLILRWRHYDGTYRSLEINAVPVFNSENILVGYQGTVRDITERLRAEESLAKERAISDALLESIPGLLYLYDENGHLVRWNKQLEIEMSYTASEMSGKHYLDRVVENAGERENVAKAVEKCMRTGKADTETLLVEKDGSIQPYSVTGVRLEIEGKPYFTGIALNIAERKKAEKALRESEEKFRLLFTQSADAILLLEDGVIVDCNDSMV